MKHFILFALVLSLVVPSLALAQGGLGSATKNLKTVVDKAEIKEGDIGNVVGKGINIALTLVGLIFLILTVYAGFLWMTARGDEGQVEKAQQIIGASVIGLIIVVSAYAITTFVTKRFDTGTGSGNAKVWCYNPTSDECFERTEDCNPTEVEYSDQKSCWAVIL